MLASTSTTNKTFSIASGPQDTYDAGILQQNFQEDILYSSVFILVFRQMLHM